MRKSTALWLCLAAICGAVLFHTTQQVTDGRERLAVINHDIQKEEETLRVLQAEWSYLNQPERLEKLSSEYLKLQALKGRQFARLEDLERPPAPVPAPAAAPAEKTQAEDSTDVAGTTEETAEDSEASLLAEAPPAVTEDGDKSPDMPRITATVPPPQPVLEKSAVQESKKTPATRNVTAPVKPAPQNPPAKPATAKAPALPTTADIAPAKATPVRDAEQKKPAADNRSFGDVIQSLGVQ